MTRLIYQEAEGPPRTANSSTNRVSSQMSCAPRIGVTTAPVEVADAATLARCVRGQWAIEAQHFVRDVTFGEDACQARTGSLPRALATFRSLAISLAHLAGWTNNTAAHDHYRNHPADALRELGLTGSRVRQLVGMREW
jgi:hypothetical protein